MDQRRHPSKVSERSGHYLGREHDTPGLFTYYSMLDAGEPLCTGRIEVQTILKISLRNSCFHRSNLCLRTSPTGREADLREYYTLLDSYPCLVRDWRETKPPWSLCFGSKLLWHSPNSSRRWTKTCPNSTTQLQAQAWQRSRGRQLHTLAHYFALPLRCGSTDPYDVVHQLRADCIILQFTRPNPHSNSHCLQRNQQHNKPYGLRQGTIRGCSRAGHLLHRCSLLANDRYAKRKTRLRGPARIYGTCVHSHWRHNHSQPNALRTRIARNQHYTDTQRHACLQGTLSVLMILH